MKTVVGIVLVLVIAGVYFAFRSRKTGQSLSSAAASAASPTPYLGPLKVEGTHALPISAVFEQVERRPVTAPMPVVLGGPPVLPAAKSPDLQLEELADPLKFVEDRTVGGIGVLLFLIDSKPKVGGVMAGSPAEVVGIQVGDIIHSVDGYIVSALPLKGISSRIQGLVGSKVVVAIEKPDHSVVSLTVDRMSRREILSAPIKVR